MVSVLNPPKSPEHEAANGRFFVPGKPEPFFKESEVFWAINSDLLPRDRAHGLVLEAIHDANGLHDFEGYDFTVAHEPDSPRKRLSLVFDARDRDQNFVWEVKEEHGDRTRTIDIKQLHIGRTGLSAVHYVLVDTSKVSPSSYDPRPKVSEDLDPMPLLERIRGLKSARLTYEYMDAIRNMQARAEQRRAVAEIAGKVGTVALFSGLIARKPYGME